MTSRKPEHGRSLADLFPDVAAEADGWDPSTVKFRSNQKRSWRCPKGHKYVAAIEKRSSGKGCPICNGKRVLPGFNDLATTNPELAAQADGWDPTTVTQSSSKFKLQWNCRNGHTWKTTPASRTNGRGCPICANKEVLPGYNDLATTNPGLASEAHGWDPTTVTQSARQTKNWKCKYGHLYPAAVYSRNSGSGCPICSNKKVLPGFNDLATTNPELAAQAVGWDPKTVTQSSGKKMEWICQMNHKYLSTVGNRTAGKNCPVCANKKVLPGFNDLATTNPDLAAEADGWDPTTVTNGAKVVARWKCKLGHQWKTVVYSRNNGVGCPVCANKKVLPGFNDLATLNPALAAEADGWDPTTVTQYSNKRHQWICNLGHRWVCPITDRSRGDGCPICSNHKVLPGFNDLATTNPDLAAEADGWDPTTVTKSSGKKRDWICNRGHRWSADPAHRTAGRGCPSCAKFGFDPNQPGFLYFIDHDGLAMYQIGISNYPDDRLADHKGRGWEVIELRGPMDGHLTQKLETDCLRALEKRGAILGNKANNEKFDGFTEAWTKQSLNVTSIKQILDWVYEDEAGQ